MTQGSLDLTTQVANGVECFGQTFIGEEARREHFLKLLAEKLKDPEFRKIEGFPIGTDEDILALSDPPYYTACPNPWIGDFLRHYGTTYDPKQLYHREPFAADVSEGKNHPIYNAHSYHTKVPHRAIMRYILHYTEPGEVIFDGFAGTGMAGVAAQLCGDPAEVQALGYLVRDDGVILDEERRPFSKLGARRAILTELSPAATFIAYNYNTPVDVDAFEREAKCILNEVEHELGWMYETKHTDKQKGRINYVVWSDAFLCTQCGGEIVFWLAAVDAVRGIVRETFSCPQCNATLSKRGITRAFSKSFDVALGQTISRAKQVPVLINYSFDGKRFEKSPDETDMALIERIEHTSIDEWFPKQRMMNGGEARRNDPIGVTHVHHFYTVRSLAVFSAIYARAHSPLLKCALLGGYTVGLRTARFLPLRWINKDTGPMKPHTAGTLYIPSLNGEQNWLKIFASRVNASSRAQLAGLGEPSLTSTQSSTRTLIAKESIDYIFLDPPFGANLSYSELNFLCESWLRVFTNTGEEAIESDSQGKSLEDYRRLITACFNEAYRVLKPGRWMTIEFSNTKAAVWNSIQAALNEAGFIVANVAALDKQQGSFKAVTTPTAVKQDLVISAYKPNDGLEERFAKRGETEEGVWDFIKTHLRNLPVVKARAGQLEFIAERDPRILYDRMVAFYVGHSTPVPLSAAEFQAGLAERFPQRDEMSFLPEQVNEYDRKRQQMEGVGQLSIFVEDEKSAVVWLRNFLNVRPSVYQDIQPEFMQQLGASWKKWETRPELHALLEQNFLCYDGNDAVPSQIHSYISTQFKELRNLAKSHPQLRHKAKDRWYVPDPRKNIDIEKLRNKRLLQEFWSYLPAGYRPPALNLNHGDNLPGLIVPVPKIPKGKKLKELRTEAVRVGFKHCYQQKDYQTILVVAEMMPESVIQEDEALQMYYDTAVTRTEQGVR